MSINNNLKNLFANYQQQQNYAKRNKLDKNSDEYKALDVNGDGKVDKNDYKQMQNEAKKLLKTENLWDFNSDNQINYKDLFMITNGIDINGDGKIDSDEKAFLKLYNSQINTAVKNAAANDKDATLADVLKLEEDFANLSAAAQKSLKSIISTIETKLIANTTKNTDVDGDGKVTTEDLKEFWKSTYNLDGNTKLKNNSKINSVLSSIEASIKKAIKKTDKTVTDKSLKALKTECLAELKKNNGVYDDELAIAEPAVEEEKNIFMRPIQPSVDGPTVSGNTVVFANGQVLTLSDGETASVDKEGKVTVTSKDGSSVKVYDKNGNLVSEYTVQPFQPIDTVKPDEPDIPIQPSVDGPTVSGNTVVFANGQVLTLSDGETASVDKEGKVTVTSKDGSSVKVYDKNGNLLAETKQETTMGNIYETKKEYKEGVLVSETVTVTRDGKSYSITDNCNQKYPALTGYGGENGGWGTITFNGKDFQTAPFVLVNFGEKAIINSDGTVEVTNEDGSSVKKYDAQGLLTSEYVYENGAEAGHKDYEYVNGQMSNVKKYDAQGLLTSEYVYENGAEAGHKDYEYVNGQMSDMKKYDAQGLLIAHCIYVNGQEIEVPVKVSDEHIVEETAAAEEVAEVETPVVAQVETPATEEVAEVETPVAAQAETPVVEEVAEVEAPVVSQVETPAAEEAATVETPAVAQVETPAAEEVAEVETPVVAQEETPVAVTPSTEETTTPTVSAKPTINGSTITFPNGNTVYGSNAVVNDDGSVTVANSNGSIIIKYNVNGQEISSERNLFNGNVLKSVYDDNGKMINSIITDKDGNKLTEFSYEYYDNGNKKSETISQQASNGEMITIKDTKYSEDGKETYFKSLDSSGNVLQLREYADNGTLIHEVNNSNYGTKSEKFYDENTGKITKEITEDTWGILSSFQNSAITKYTYNNETGKLTSKISTDANGNQTTTQYDVNENVTSEITTDKEGNVTSTKTFEYYSDGVQKSSKEYDSTGGCIEDLQYNEQGKMTKSIRKSSYYTQTCEYNDDGKLISSSITDKNGDVTTTNAQEYYSDGTLKSETSYSYDEKGVATPTKQVTYSQEGKETSYKKWDCNGNLTDLREYDANTGKLTREIDAYYSWNFDKNGNHQYYLSSQTEKIYDANTGKIISNTYTNSAGDVTKTEYEYNDSGKETKQTVSVNNVVTKETNTEYFDDGTKKAKNEYTYKNGEKLQTIQATYDTSGNETYYKQLDSNGEISELREYSSETGKLINAIETNKMYNGSYVSKIQTTYNTTGNKTKVVTTDQDGGVTTKDYEYTYDESGKLTGGKITTLNPDGTKVISEYTYQAISNSPMPSDTMSELLNTQVIFSSTKYDADGNKIGEYSNSDYNRYTMMIRLSFSADTPCAGLEAEAQKAFEQQASATPTIDGNTIKFAGRSVTFTGTAVVNDDGTVSVTSEDGKITIKYDKTGAVISFIHNPDYTLGDSSVYVAPTSTSDQNTDGSVTVTAKSGCTTTIGSDGKVTTATDMYGESLSDSTLATEGQLGSLAGVRIADTQQITLPAMRLLLWQRPIESSSKVLS